ncbi:MAG: SDR family oxidoreductase [Candidatus Omnitrophica bacterium]|nr:SDR family oxidoreductase [Candidatus Omnitrophota bacterium]
MNVSLRGTKILVTGASGVVGGAILAACREAGAWTAGSYFRNEEEAGRLAAQGVFMAKADLSDRRQTRDLVKNVLQEAGSLDGLVYCAGNTRDRTVAKLTDEEWDDVLEVHLGGLFAAVQEVLPSMRERRRGKIVTIGSLSGLIGRLGQPNYSAAKAGMIGFIKSVAKETGRFGVTANVICPGFIDSGMTRSAPEEAWERAKAASVLGAISSVETVASFSVWLLSDLCRGVTGQVFQLDSRI